MELATISATQHTKPARILARGDYGHSKSFLETLPVAVLIGVAAALLFACAATEYDELKLSGNYHSSLATVGCEPGSINAYAPRFVTEGGLEFGHIRDPKLDEMWARQSTITDLEKRRQAVRELLEYIYENHYWAPLAMANRPLATWDHMKGWIGPSDDAFSVDYETTWIQLPRY